MAETTVTTPSGEDLVIVHPDGASREQILKYAKLQFDARLDEGEKEERLNLMEYLSDTPQRFEDTKQRYAEAFTTDTYDPLARTGQLDAPTRAAALVNTGLETAVGAGSELYKRYAPEAVQDFVSEAYKGSPVESAVNYAGELASEYPMEATALEVGGALSMVGKPASVGVPRVPNRTLRNATASATEAKLKEELDGIARTLTPEDYTKARGTFEIKGPLNTNVYVPDPTENDVINYIHTLGDYPSSRNPVENFRHVDENISSLEDKLQAHVNQSRNPKIDLDEMSDELFDSIDDFYQDMDYRTLSKESRNQVDVFLEQTVELLADRSVKGKITARDVLEIRRELDKRIFNNNPTNFIENPDISSAKQVAGNFVRQRLNEKFLEVLPTDQAYEYLNGMSMLLKAKSLLKTKASKTVGDTALTRAVKVAEDVIGLNFPSTPLAVAATVGAGGAYLVGSPLLSGLLAGAGAGYGLARAARPVRRKAVLRDLLRATDSMLKGANITIEEMRKLRADKIMLSQMLSEVNSEEDTNE